MAELSVRNGKRDSTHDEKVAKSMAKGKDWREGWNIRAIHKISLTITETYFHTQALFFLIYCMFLKIDNIPLLYGLYSSEISDSDFGDLT